MVIFHGKNGLAVADLAEVVFKRQFAVSCRIIECTFCGYASNQKDIHNHVIILHDGLIGYNSNELLSVVFNRWMNKGNVNCTICGQHAVRRMQFQSPPSLLFFDVPHKRLAIDTELHVDNVLLTLKGAIYIGDFHYICRFVDRYGIVWVHDGMLGRFFVREGHISSVNWHICRRKELTSLLYFRDLNYST